MRFFKSFRIVLSALLLGLVGVVFSGGVARAEEVPEYRLQISPVRLDLELRPGKVAETSFRVQNTGREKFDFKLGLMPYSVSGDDYTPDYSTRTKYNDLMNWIEFSEQEGSVEPGQEKIIEVRISVPKDVPAGGQYAVITAAMTNDEANATSSGNISAMRSVGLLVYSENVEGQTRRTAKVVENKVPSFIFKSPITVTSMVENTGNVHAAATYTMQVFPLFSDEEVYTNEGDPEKRTILPETKRFNSMSWEGAPQLGIFRVRQTIRIFDEVSMTEKIVFLCPIWLLFIILLIIFCAIFWVVSRMRGRKEY